MRSAAWPELLSLARAVDEGESRSGREVADLAVDHRFRFAGRELRLPEVDWSTGYESPLWTYNLQYFDYAVDLARAWRASGEPRYGDCLVRLWNGWLEAAGSGRARIEPYPTSVRCMNALRSLWLVEDRVSADFSARLVSGTRAQLDWLRSHLERHLRANHLLKNLAALTWGSLAFADPPPGAVQARDELWRELAEQVLPDGGHFERSPMYHAAALDDFLRTLAMCRVGGAAVPKFVPGRLAEMTRALQLLSRSDGTLHLFNDTADGERPDRNDVVALAADVLESTFAEPAGAFALQHTGYHGCVDTDGDYRFVVDAGPAGPTYQPGHAHCDMLSFELDVHGRPFVVDSGLHGYDGDPYREYVRSTRAHNTVAIDGLDQHEMWATFRVARRGEILSATSGPVGDEGFEFRGAARSYHDRSAVHERRVKILRGTLAVTDRVEGANGRSLASWLHVHPDFRLRPSAAGFVAAGPDEGAPAVAIEFFGADDIRLVTGARDPVQGWYCPRFGRAIPASVIEMRIAANEGRDFGYRLRWPVA
ncbi:MAG: heparinase II/III domain-containing protein [Gemmatimonadota bacterium]